MKNKDILIEALEDTPIIPAIKDEDNLQACLLSDAKVVFVLYGDICNISYIIEKIKDSGKMALVHMDLVTGLASKEISVDYLKNNTKADGIISTKPLLIKRAKELGLFSIFRVFVIDSLALTNIDKQLKDIKPDCIEILPGVMPKVIKKIVKESKMPLIAGGLIADKEDVCNALDAGALSVSSTNRRLWDL